jgi:hypothetical protein
MNHQLYLNKAGGRGRDESKRAWQNFKPAVSSQVFLLLFEAFHYKHFT